MIPIKDHNPSHKFPLVTVIVILINIVAFFFELTTPDLDKFLYAYALVPSQINFADVGTLYPFITSMFLHGGWLHIISNMWFLWIFGDNVEATLGHLKYALFYLVTGIAASLAQYLFSPDSTIPMLGASGAIAGVLGAYLVLFPHARIESLVAMLGGFLTRINVPAGFMLVYWFITQVFAGAGSIATTGASEGGVAFFAHIGGFVAGWLILKLLKPSLSWYRLE